jgi:hypothetical protein
LIARPRPVFLNLVHLGMSVGALVSVPHRVSGLLVGTLVCIYPLYLSLREPQQFGRVRELFNLTTVRMASVMFTCLGGYARRGDGRCSSVRAWRRRE